MIQVQWPRPEMYTDWQSWARAMIQALEDALRRAS